MDKELLDKSTCTREGRPHNQYHPAFCNAMELELFFDRALLEFRQSVKMNSLPREIDFLIIRKEKEGEIKNELARFFKKCNIWEFKSYRDSLSVSVYHKTMSYAYEYLSLNKDVEGIHEVTLSFLREGKPRNLIRWLARSGFEKLSSPDWVVRFRKTGCPDVQIVNTAHSQAPVFLRLLSHKVDSEDIKSATEYINMLPDGERDKARIVIELSYRMNKDKGGDQMSGFFETYVDPLKEIIEQKDVQLEEKDVQLEQKEVQLEQKDAQIKLDEVEIRKRDELINRMKEEIRRLGGNIAMF